LFAFKPHAPAWGYSHLRNNPKLTHGLHGASSSDENHGESWNRNGRGLPTVEFRDRHVWIEKGEFLIVPHGVEHRPVAEQEVHVLLFEPAATLNTGNVQNDLTVDALERIFRF
jgi:hypothetical protein